MAGEEGVEPSLDCLTGRRTTLMLLPNGGGGENRTLDADLQDQSFPAKLRPLKIVPHRQQGGEWRGNSDRAPRGFRRSYSSDPRLHGVRPVSLAPRCIRNPSTPRTYEPFLTPCLGRGTRKTTCPCPSAPTPCIPENRRHFPSEMRLALRATFETRSRTIHNQPPGLDFACANMRTFGCKTSIYHKRASVCEIRIHTIHTPWGSISGRDHPNSF